MKKNWFFLISFIIILIAVISYVIIYHCNFKADERTENYESNNDVEHMELEQVKIKGYYYYGFLDQREKLSIKEDEEEYFYHMDNYFFSYYNDLFVVTKNDAKNEVNLDYFEEIGGLYLINIYDKLSIDVENGDYISIMVDSEVKETFPMQVSNLNNLKILFSRKSTK